MRQISEKVDLSKKVLEVDVESPIFEKMFKQFNYSLIEVIKKVYDGDFESGDVTLKLTLEVPRRFKEFPVEGDIGEQPTVKMYEYKALDFNHSVSTTLKKVDKVSGSYYGEKELEKDTEGNFIEKPIEDPQITMFDK
jgi:hypothetical protein